MKKIYQQILDGLEQGKNSSIVTEFSGEKGRLGQELSRRVAFAERQASGDETLCVAPTLEEGEDRWFFSEPFTPRERLIILGGGHIALPLCAFAAGCGFAVTVVDDRPSFANGPRFPEAAQVLCDSFPKAIERLEVTPYDYVVVITRGHRHDATCLRALLPLCETAYLGMIGSRRRVRELLNLLEEEGYSRERMDRICTPIGLPIGAVTPEEIAVSILSEIISYKRLPGKSRGAVQRTVNESDADLDVIRYLAGHEGPLAIVTVMRTKGSTPRKAGAKMAVDPAGNIVGSIGGGCSEGAVIRDAIDIIGTGTYLTKLIDMTGDVAESEGMVCGGIMEVLIEDASN